MLPLPSGGPYLGKEEPAALRYGTTDLLVGLDLLLAGPDEPPLGLVHGPAPNTTNVVHILLGN